MLTNLTTKLGDLAGGLNRCKYCKWSPNMVDAGMAYEADQGELGAHMAIHHPEELRKTHPHLFDKR